MFDPKIEESMKAKFLEQEINELAKFVEDLQLQLGASEATVAAETKKLKELQNIAMKNFRQELAQKLRRQKSRAYYIKEKFGLGPGGGPVSSHGHRLSKAKSIALASSPVREELPSVFGGGQVIAVPADDSWYYPLNSMPGPNRVQKLDEKKFQIQHLHSNIECRSPSRH